MGITVRETIERTESEILRSGGSVIPAWGTSEDALDADDLSFTMSERVALSDDSVIEFMDDSMELSLVKDEDNGEVTLQTRGYLESAAAVHASGVRIIADNPFPRIVLFNACKTLIDQLYGYGLWVVAWTDDLTLSTREPVSLPAGAKGVLDPIYYLSGATWTPIHRNEHFRVFPSFTGANSAPALSFFYGSHGAGLRVPYKAVFDTTTDFDLDTDLDDVGIPTALQPDLPLGIAARVLTGKDVSAATAEHIRRQLENQSTPVGTRISVSRALWQMFMQSVSLERNNLLEQFPVTVG